VNEDVASIAGVSADYLDRERARELAEIERRRAVFMGSRRPVPLDGRTAIVVDDGIATGATAAVALRAVRRARPRHLVLAVPVAAADSLEKLRPLADEVVCLYATESFPGVGAYYSDFAQLTDRDVSALLDAASGHQSRPSS
jgi:predicted phosphoribosyltransferase